MKVVKVLWIDSCNSNMNWTVAEDIETELMYIDSFGVVVKDTDEFLAIAQNYGDDPEQYSNITTIPKGCIKEVFVIHEDSVYENGQNTAYKVEPKFKVGNWVVDKNGTVQQILSYKNGIYKHTNGYSSKMFEDEWRLWDIIKDAKDGDILVVERDKTPFIFKGFDKFHPECPIAYCGLDDNRIFIVNSSDGWWTNEKVEPATKEQRNLLFQKIKESGYEWDAEKKELKIIDWSKHIKYEPNGPSIIEQKQVIDYPDSLPKDNWELVHEFVEKFGRIPEDEDELNVLVEYVLKRQKSTWGEEDEKMFRNLHNLIYVVQDCDCDSNKKKELSDWIESLKGRYQSKQEWNEEDEKEVAVLEAYIRSNDWSDKHIDRALGIVDELVNKVKSLKPQNNWKPSDEQMDALQYVYRSCNPLPSDKLGWDSIRTLELMYQELKKLREE